MGRFVLRALLVSLPVAVLLLLWEHLIPAGSRLAFLFSRPSEIAAAAGDLATKEIFWLDALKSASTLLAGYSLGVTGGFLAGLGVWLSGRASRYAEIYLLAIGSVPIFALAPLLIFALGIGSTTRITIVTLAVFVPVSLSVYSAAKEAASQFSQLASSFGALSRLKALRYMVMPGAFYLSLPVLKSAANAALVATFLSEWISAENGLAKFVLASMSVYNVPAMWVGLGAFVALGVGFGVVVNLLENLLMPWRRSPSES